jgi:hypothetical protein
LDLRRQLVLLSTNPDVEQGTYLIDGPSHLNIKTPGTWYLAIIGSEYMLVSTSPAK